MVTLRVISAILICNYKPGLCGCTNTEYEMNGQCCSMCSPGNYVYWDCHEDVTTTCTPCPASTYMDKPNQLTKCFPCTVCEEKLALKTKQVCNKSSDTVCGPQEGFYCINQTQKGSCISAVKHTVCGLGQYIKQTGTEFSDTVCNDCPDESYSDGTLSKSHTLCNKNGTVDLYGIVVVVVIVVVIVVVVVIIIAIVIMYALWANSRPAGATVALTAKETLLLQQNSALTQV